MFTVARTAARWAARHAIPAVAATALILGAAGGGIGYAIAGQHSSAPPSGAASPHPVASGQKVRAGAPSGRAGELLQRALGLLAKETGQTVAAVRGELEAGQSVNQVAGAKAPALEAAILAELKRVADHAVSAGRITAAQESAALAAARTRVEALMAEPGTQLLHDAQRLIQGIRGHHAPKAGAPAAGVPSPAA